MNLLPWFLDWPPSRRAVAAFLVVTAFSLGTLALFGGITDDADAGNVTVERTDLTVSLNDAAGIPDVDDGHGDDGDAGHGDDGDAGHGGDGTVQSCLAVGTPRDSVSVLGDVTIDVPRDRDRSGASQLAVVLSFAGTAQSTTEAVEETGDVTASVFWIADDDGTLAVGENATLQVSIRSRDDEVATAERPVAVEDGSRSYDC